MSTIPLATITSASSYFPQHLSNLASTFIHPSDIQSTRNPDQDTPFGPSSGLKLCLNTIYNHKDRLTCLGEIIAVLSLPSSLWMAMCRLRESDVARAWLEPLNPHLFQYPSDELWVLLGQIRAHPLWPTIQKHAIDFIINGHFTGAADVLSDHDRNLSDPKSITPAKHSPSIPRSAINRQESLAPPEMTQAGSLSPMDRSPRTPENRPSPTVSTHPRGRLHCPYPGCKHEPFIHDSRFKNHLRDKHGIDMRRLSHRRGDVPPRMPGDKTVQNHNVYQRPMASPERVQAMAQQGFGEVEAQFMDLQHFPEEWVNMKPSLWTPSSFSHPGSTPEFLTDWERQSSFFEQDVIGSVISDYTDPLPSTGSHFAPELGKPQLLPEPLTGDRSMSREEAVVGGFNAHGSNQSYFRTRATHDLC